MIQETLTLIAFPILRSVSGWLENALKDNKISAFEWSQLGSTVLRVGLIGVGTYFGLNEMGVDVTALGAGASSILIDLILKSIKK